jgi:hypothetical protein
MKSPALERLIAAQPYTQYKQAADLLHNLDNLQNLLSIFCELVKMCN